MTRLIAPFEIRHAPLRQYCEVVFSGHDYYRSIELQYLDITPDRQGYVVLMGRRDGKLDVLSEPGLALDETWCLNDPSVSHYPLGRIETIDLEGVVLETGGKGVDAKVSLKDGDGRLIEMVVASAPSGPAKARNLFIPASPNPKIKMLWFLYVFAFGALRPSDKIDIRIDGKPVKPNRWPWPIGFTRHIQGRYANDIAFFSLNPPTSELPVFIEEDDAFDLVPVEGSTAPAIRSWQKYENGHRLKAQFDPPIDAIPITGEAVAGDGAFKISIDDIVIAKGRYQLSSRDSQTNLALTGIDQYWRPPENDFSVWMLEFYHRLKVGRRRWHWKATISSDDGRVCDDGVWVLR